MINSNAAQLSNAIPWPDWLTVKQTASYLSMNAEHVRRLIHQGGLPAYRVGEGVGMRINRRELDEWLLSHPVTQPDPRRNGWKGRRKRANS